MFIENDNGIYFWGWDKQYAMGLVITHYTSYTNFVTLQLSYNNCMCVSCTIRQSNTCNICWLHCLLMQNIDIHHIVDQCKTDHVPCNENATASQTMCRYCRSMLDWSCSVPSFHIAFIPWTTLNLTQQVWQDWQVWQV